MLHACQVLKKLGHFHEGVISIGGVQTVKRLFSKADASEGFRRLWDAGPRPRSWCPKGRSGGLELA